jgi:hypothetical protein
MYVRAKPCVCEHCLEENWDLCTIGGWKLKKMNKKGLRNPNAKHIQQQLSEEAMTTADGEWEVASIQQQRVRAGKVQYLVEWKGYPTMLWVDADKLDADEILEDWELQNEIDAGESNIVRVEGEILI